MKTNFYYDDTTAKNEGCYKATLTNGESFYYTHSSLENKIHYNKIFIQAINNDALSIEAMPLGYIPPNNLKPVLFLYSPSHATGEGMKQAFANNINPFYFTSTAHNQHELDNYISVWPDTLAIKVLGLYEHIKTQDILSPNLEKTKLEFIWNDEIVGQASTSYFFTHPHLLLFNLEDAALRGAFVATLKDGQSFTYTTILDIEKDKSISFEREGEKELAKKAIRYISVDKLREADYPSDVVQVFPSHTFHRDIRISGEGYLNEYISKKTDVFFRIINETNNMYNQSSYELVDLNFFSTTPINSDTFNPSLKYYFHSAVACEMSGEIGITLPNGEKFFYTEASEFATPTANFNDYVLVKKLSSDTHLIYDFSHTKNLEDNADEDFESDISDNYLSTIKTHHKLSI